MSELLTVGKEFHSFEELNKFISTYEKQAKKKLSRYNTKELNGDLKDVLKYHSLNYQCVCYGKYVSRAKTDRRVKETLKCDCKFIIKIILSKSRKSLIISKSSCFEHNEMCQVKNVYEPEEDEEKTNIPNETSRRIHNDKDKKSYRDSKKENAAAQLSDICDPSLVKEIPYHTSSNGQVILTIGNQTLLDLGITEQYENNHSVSGSLIKEVSSTNINEKDKCYDEDENQFDCSEEVIDDTNECWLEAFESNKQISKKAEVKQDSKKEDTSQVTGLKQAFLSQSPNEKNCIKPQENQTVDSFATTDVSSVKVNVKDKCYDEDEMNLFDWSEDFIIKINDDNKNCSLQASQSNEQASYKKDKQDKQDSKQSTLVLSKKDQSNKNIISKKIEKNFDLPNMKFEEQKTTCRGRPLGSVKTRTCGARATPGLLPYGKKNNFNKLKTLLRFLVKKEIITNVLDRSHQVGISDLTCTTDNISDTFIDENVNINILKSYFASDAFAFLKSLIKKKSKTYFTCPVCNEEASDNTIYCESCCMWLHIKCSGTEKKSLKSIKDYFCAECVNLS